MTEHQYVTKLVDEITKQLERKPDPEDLLLVRKIWDAGVAYGRKNPDASPENNPPGLGKGE